MRSVYQPVELRNPDGINDAIELSGNWLFAPDQEKELSGAADPQKPDTDWHVLDVPNSWNEIEWWIYYRGRGTSHRFTHLEEERCANITFNTTATKAGWYRQWISVPADLKGKSLSVQFQAVASLADVYWNGHKIGSHVGMFGRFECDATQYLKFGESNLLAVHVASAGADPKAANEVAEVAVTMPVTSETLNSLPHTTFRAGMAGIWQPVTLFIREPTYIADVYFQPRLDGATIETQLHMSAEVPKKANKRERALTVRHTILADAHRTLAGKPVWEHRLSDRVSGRSEWETALPAGAASGTSATAVTTISGLQPKLWSPEHPNLYRLRTELRRGDELVDERYTTVGFRTFEARAGKLWLNGKPYFLRGANMPPAGLRPNDSALAAKFMKLMHDGNQMVTRFHMCPPPSVWMDAADEYGVGVSIEGSWPWIGLGNSELPSRELQLLWIEEMEAIARQNRNHPSLMIMTISNESHFQGDKDTSGARKLKKFRLFDEVIRRTRAFVPDIPIVFHSGYARIPRDYEEILKPNGFDDGDIDDTHHYYGWYAQSPFHLDVQKDVESARGSPDRPHISQEASTGYPDNDTGHSSRSYITLHRTPQIWVGQHALYSARPDMFLETHALITKETEEKIRRDNTRLDGWNIFANCCWFRDVYDAERITPWPVYWSARYALQPVLVSLESADRHFNAGARFSSAVVVVNDDSDRELLTNLQLRWRIFGQQDEPGTSGTIPIRDCAYDSKTSETAEFVIPDVLAKPRSKLSLRLDLFSGQKRVSENEYDLLGFAVDKQAARREVSVLEQGSGALQYLNGLGYDAQPYLHADLDATTVPIIVSADQDMKNAGNADAVRQFLENGGRMLFLEPWRELRDPKGTTVPLANTMAAALQSYLPAVQVVRVNGDFADVLRTDLLEGLDPMDMHWWNARDGDQVRVCDTSYRLPETSNVRHLVQHIQPHAYIKEKDVADITTWPVFEVQVGKGRAIFSSLLLAEDPVAKRFLSNLVEHRLFSD